MVASAAVEVRGPQLTAINSTSASLIIHCRLESTLNLRCWSDDGDEHIINNAGHFHHPFNLRGLQPATRYHYQITGETYDSGVLSFQTAPRFENSVSFCVYGHSRRQEIIEATHNQLIKQMIQLQPQFVVHTGNLLDGGPRSDPSLFSRDWTLNFYKPLQPLMNQLPFYLCPGPHDIDFINGDQGVQHAFPFLTGKLLYVVERGPMAMVVLRLPHRLSEWQRQAEIIERAFQQISFARWRIVCMHVPPHAAGMRGWIKERGHGLWELMQRYRIDLVISGRQQQYQRLYPLRLSEEDHHAITIISTSLGMEKLRDRDPLLLRYDDKSPHFVHVTCSSDFISIQARGQHGELLDKTLIHRQRYDAYLKQSKVFNSLP